MCVERRSDRDVCVGAGAGLSPLTAPADPVGVTEPPDWVEAVALGVVDGVVPVPLFVPSGPQAVVGGGRRGPRSQGVVLPVFARSARWWSPYVFTWFSRVADARRPAVRQDPSSVAGLIEESGSGEVWRASVRCHPDWSRLMDKPTRYTLVNLRGMHSVCPAGAASQDDQVTPRKITQRVKRSGRR